MHYYNVHTLNHDLVAVVAALSLVLIWGATHAWRRRRIRVSGLLLAICVWPRSMFRMKHVFARRRLIDLILDMYWSPTGDVSHPDGLDAAMRARGLDSVIVAKPTGEIVAALNGGLSIYRGREYREHMFKVGEYRLHIWCRKFVPAPRVIVRKQLVAMALSSALVGERDHVNRREIAVRQSEDQLLLDAVNWSRYRHRYLTSIAHELRTPAAILYGASETMVHRWNTIDENTRVAFVSMIQRESRKLRRLIEDVLVDREIVQSHIQIDEPDARMWDTRAFISSSCTEPEIEASDCVTGR